MELLESSLDICDFTDSGGEFKTVDISEFGDSPNVTKPFSKLMLKLSIGNWEELIHWHAISFSLVSYGFRSTESNREREKPKTINFMNIFIWIMS